ncbi:MAG: hypothetical protein V4670_05385 [Bacteroidota bacterium]
MNKVVFFLFFIQSIFSQSFLKGKVIADANPDGIMVVNYSTKVSTVTENGGFFTIEAKIGDKLVITSNRIEGVEIKLDSYSFKKEMLYIRVKSKVNQLEEVQIKSITAKSLGVVSGKIKEYTPAERKLRTAEKFKWFSPLLIPFGGMSVDGLINQISGRTNMLKKELQVEHKEKLIEKIDAMFEEPFYVETLKIQPGYIKGFQLYSLDYPKFVEAVKDNNRFLATFLFGEIATEYKSLILLENK